MKEKKLINVFAVLVAMLTLTGISTNASAQTVTGSIAAADDPTTT